MPKLTINLGPKKPTEHAFFAVSLSNITETNIIENESLWSFSDQILIILTLINHCLLRACLYSNSLFVPQELDKNSRERDQRRGKKPHKEKHKEKHKKKKKKKYQSDSDSSDSGSDVEFLS